MPTDTTPTVQIDTDDIPSGTIVCYHGSLTTEWGTFMVMHAYEGRYNLTPVGPSPEARNPLWNAGRASITPLPTASLP